MTSAASAPTDTAIRTGSVVLCREEWFDRAFGGMLVVVGAVAVALVIVRTILALGTAVVPRSSGVLLPFELVLVTVPVEVNAVDDTVSVADVADTTVDIIDVAVSVLQV
jgi:hypothetical protein